MEEKMDYNGKHPHTRELDVENGGDRNSYNQRTQDNGHESLSEDVGIESRRPRELHTEGNNEKKLWEGDFVDNDSISPQIYELYGTQKYSSASEYSGGNSTEMAPNSGKREVRKKGSRRNGSTNRLNGSEDRRSGSKDRRNGSVDLRSEDLRSEDLRRNGGIAINEPTSSRGNAGQGRSNRPNKHNNAQPDNVQPNNVQPNNAYPNNAYPGNGYVDPSRPQIMPYTPQPSNRPDMQQNSTGYDGLYDSYGGGEMQQTVQDNPEFLNASGYNPYLYPYPPDSQGHVHSSVMVPTNYRLQVPEQVNINYEKSKRTYRIPLTSEGNLVMDLPTPKHLLGLSKYTTPAEEFCYTRYTAITCNPEEFVSKGYRLKVQEMGRRAELLIALTMYNEDENLFLRSMSSVLKNIRHLCSRNNSSTWGSDSWKKIVVCIISDGRNKIDHRVLGVLGVMGVYQDGIMKDHVNEAPVTAHLFEFTSQIYINEALEIKNAERGYVPAQIIFCLKEKNAKKINSHRWLFQSFAPLLSTNICILIDVGTRPTDDSLYHLWKAFKNPKVGGACGEIIADTGKLSYGLLNPLVAAQNFEYKTSNILDKPLESVCGYISVLPGAFSAYRYSALVGKPLRAYFLGETMENEVSLLTANTYLAEDRILCLELVSKRNEAWTLKYVKSAKARTDVPRSISELISQRRRWLNGSFCAGLHALFKSYKVIFISGHTAVRKFVLLLEFSYNTIVLLLNWLGISLFFLTFYFVLKGANSTTVPNAPKPFFGYEEQFIFYSKYAYVMAIIAVFISSMGNRPQGLRIIFFLSVFTFAIFNLVIIYVVGFEAYNTISANHITLERVPSIFLTDRAFRIFAISILFSFGTFAISSILYLSPWHLLTSSIQYLLVMPTYINIMPIYSFCNLHDVSWGTKQSTSAFNDLGVAKSSTTDTGKSVFDVEIRGSQAEIDTNYRKFIKQLENKPTKMVVKKDIFSIREDYLKSFRTRVVLLWILTNGALSVILTSDLLSKMVYVRLGLEVVDYSGGAANPFLTCFSYVMFFVNGVRLTGSILYLIFNMMGA